MGHTFGEDLRCVNHEARKRKHDRTPILYCGRSWPDHADDPHSCRFDKPRKYVRGEPE